MATDTGLQGQDFCRILVLTDEGQSMGTGTTNVQNGLKLEKHACLDCPVISNNHKPITMETSDPFPSCVVTVDIEKGTTDVSKMEQDGCGSIKTEIALTKPLRRQNSLQTSETIPPLMNHIFMLLKFDNKAEKLGIERGYEGANNRWRKGKRPGLFDSRQIVILFSILSSMGTLVLIYLTLRVRQVSESYIHG